MLSKNLFNILFPLTTKQPWLAYKQAEIGHLLTEDCKNSDEQNLVLDLLTRFKYLSNSDFSSSLDKIVAHIVTNYDQKNTMVVAATMDSNADSAQFVLYQMKPIFQKKGWDSPKLVNQANKIVRYFPEYQNVIFVDEFIGSGETAFGRIANLKRDLKGRGYNDYSIHVYSIAVSTVGKQRLIEEGIDLVSDIVITRGISDHFEEQKEEKLRLMLQLECLLSKEYNSRPMPSLGHGKTESLYAREDGNTPNNVFPVFWWPFYATNTRRPTILTRSMGDA